MFTFEYRNRDLIERARQSDILAVAQRYGAKLKRAGRCEFVGPCPDCGGHDRFSINTRKQVWNCRRCNEGGDIIKLVQHLSGSTFTEAITTLSGETMPTARNQERRTIRPSFSPPNSNDDHECRQHKKAAWLWSQRRPIQGTIAEKYLLGREITCPLQSTLAFLPPRKPGQHPAMIAAFGLPDEPEPSVLGEPRNVKAVHLTLLRSDGSSKAEVERPKLFVGSPGNLPIVLAPPNDLLGMAITEGIEDALTVHQATGLGAWAAGSAGHMPALAQTLPEYIENVTICAHADKAGHEGAFSLADALDRRGVLEVLIEGGLP